MSYIYSYIRHSKGVEDQPNSALAQREAVRKAIEYVRTKPEFAQHELGGEFYDCDVSASKVDLFDRPAGRQMQNRIAPGDFLVFAKFDRVWRSALNFHQDVRWLKLHEIGWLVADQPGMDTTTPYGMFFASMLSALAQLETDMMSSRTKEGLEARKQRGLKLVTHAPLGYRMERKGDGLTNRGHRFVVAVPCPASRKAVERVYRLWKTGLTHEQIGDVMRGTPEINQGLQYPCEWGPDVINKYVKFFNRNKWGAKGNSKVGYYPIDKSLLTGRIADKDLVVMVDVPGERGEEEVMA